MVIKVWTQLNILHYSLLNKNCLSFYFHLANKRLQCKFIRNLSTASLTAFVVRTRQLNLRSRQRLRPHDLTLVYRLTERLQHLDRLRLDIHSVVEFSIIDVPRRGWCWRWRCRDRSRRRCCRRRRFSRRRSLHFCRRHSICQFFFIVVSEHVR